MTDQLGTLLRQLRRRAGLTQEQLSERSGVSVRTIRKMEADSPATFRLGTMGALAEALGVDAGGTRLLSRAMVSNLLGAAPEAAGTGPGPLPPPIPVQGEIADAAEELAVEMRRHWRQEEENSQIQSPFPLPVRWRNAPDSLTDHAASIQHTPSVATPDRIDLSGDLQRVSEVYRQVPSGRLVVLGRAGSGKSVLTMRFVLDQLAARRPRERVPVLFSVGSWDPLRTSLRNWLIDQLLHDHPGLTRRTSFGDTLAAALVDADLVLPVLDGFDEIAEGLRGVALDVLNAVSLPLVLTSRYDEFVEAVTVRGPFFRASGIELTDLTIDDLAHYLPYCNFPSTSDRTSWTPVLVQLAASGSGAGLPLARVLSTPLMVMLARTMYSGTSDREPYELLDTERFPDENALEEHLLAGFVPVVYRRQSRIGRESPERAAHWLGYLAHQLARSSRDQQDLAWWRIGDPLRPGTRLLAVVVTSALCVTLASWVVSLFYAPPTGRTFLAGAAAGIAFGSAHAVLAVLGRVAFNLDWFRLRPRLRRDRRGPVRTFVDRFGAVLLAGYVAGLGCASALALQRRLFYNAPFSAVPAVQDTLISMLVSGLILGTGTGLAFGLRTSWGAPLDVASAATPAGLLASNRAMVVRRALVLAPTLSLAIALGALSIGLFDGALRPPVWMFPDSQFIGEIGRTGSIYSYALLIGAIGGIGGACSYALSFSAWGRWLALSRIWLPLTGKLPWNTMAFFDDAHRRGVLRAAGAVYQFRHPSLQNHFARPHRQNQAGLATFQGVRLRNAVDDAARRRRMALVLILCSTALFLTVALLSVHDLLSSWSHHGRLLPGDTNAVVGSIIGIGGALGTLIGVTLTAFARLVQARGRADADVMRARAELIRAEAEMHRARTRQNPGPAPLPEASPDAGPATPES
ncbi:helix-turn-helix domain-containing protein [Streptomyces sp. SID2563]|nr:helix-turn-helix domain-containing protein [Streptomyces sp. SID2563]